jgi:hypothetical protein
MESKRAPDPVMAQAAVNRFFYGVKGTRPAGVPLYKLIVGVFVDGQLIETFRMDISDRNEGKESPYFFTFPGTKKNPGAHAVVFRIATTNDVDPASNKVKAWSLGESRAFAFTIQ